MNLYIFQWISELGGADTRLKHLIKLFSKNKNINLFIIPNHNERILEKENVNFLEKNNVKILTWDKLPKKMNGYGIAFSNFLLFDDFFRIEKIKQSGLKFIWSNDMVWRKEKEIEAYNNNYINYTLYTSDFHKNQISDQSSTKSKEIIMPNYFDKDSFLFIERNRNKNNIVVGKHSRPDNMKFSDNFPLFYTHLNLENANYKIMGFDNSQKERFKWFNFDERWCLLKPNAEDTHNFLGSLDFYIYNSHYKFIETQCRATIEASLSGLPVIAPKKNNFLNQIWHERTGFLWDTYEECKYFSKILEKYKDLRFSMGKKASLFSREIWCDEKAHFSLWEKILL